MQVNSKFPFYDHGAFAGNPGTNHGVKNGRPWKDGEHPGKGNGHPGGTKPGNPNPGNPHQPKPTEPEETKPMEPGNPSTTVPGTNVNSPININVNVNVQLPEQPADQGPVLYRRCFFQGGCIGDRHYPIRSSGLELYALQQPRSTFHVIV